jgi:very-short-patch-repair endonuclease
MAQAFVSVKNLAAYCLDYARLVTPVLVHSSAKTGVLGIDILDYSLFFTQESIDETLVLPFTLDLRTKRISITEASDLTSIEIAEEDDEDGDLNEEQERHLRIAQQLEDLNRKFLTSSFTKELRLEFGFVSFSARPENQNGEAYANVSEALFSLPVQILKIDHAGKREYTLSISDTTVAVNISFLDGYLPSEYYDQLCTFVAVHEGERRNDLPIDEVFLDELWAQIRHFLTLVEATDVSQQLEVDRSIIALKTRSNYFLSQDLLELGKLEETDLLDTALSAWTSDDQMSLNRTVSDEGVEELFFPFAYDKWQLQVLGIIDNKAAIVEGPPGTGKSQTIANLLCHIAAEGKTVLFVSQKDQAIRGVKDKLKSLDTPSLYGYIPDRNSVLHSEEDEADSASHSLVALAREWAMPDSVDPRLALTRVSTLKPRFLESIDQERTLYVMYDQLAALEQYDFDDTKISLQWWKDYTASVLATSKLQAVITDYSPKHTGYIAEHDASYSLLEIDYKVAYETIKRTIEAFDQTAFDRGGLKRALKDIQLKQLLRQTTTGLPQEMYDQVMQIALSDDSKATRKAQLMLMHNFLVFCYERQQLQLYSDKRQTLLIEARITPEALIRLERLIDSEPLETLFASIEKHRQLHNAILSAERFNSNELRSHIMEAKQHYAINTSDYLRNRLWTRREQVRAQKNSRAILERIARSLSKSKRAFKTFDRLKSNPENFRVMSSVVPIWMMSLDDASRVLPMQKNLFDYVIVDEASQCNIAYALPAMYRSQHIVFFGDTLQMRDSTTLFKTNEQLNAIALKHGIAEDYQIKASEDSVKSVMDIASLAGFQKTTLQYHYRSPKELIGFSNQYIYQKNGRGLQVINDNCLVFEDTGRVMINHMVQARPDMDISERSNIAEAYFIKQLIEKLRTDETTKDKSIAVLAFFNEQAELIRKVVEDPQVKVSIIDGIQGDERDIIIYSFVISSPDQKNRYLALTGEGGEVRKESNEGRINVAFSRAKLQVHAVTSLQPYLWPEGIWIKKYLEYIDEHGMAADHHDINEQQFDSKFEEQVFMFVSQALSAEEYMLRTQVKSCGFLIDLVIQHKKTGKRLAVECDGPTHFESGDGQVYVANDYERESILMTAGWSFYRLPYSDWRETKAVAQQELLDYVSDYFGVRPTKAKPVEATEATIRPPQALEVTEVDIPDELISSLRAAKASTKTRFRFKR